MPRTPPLLPLAVAAVVVPAVLTAFGFAVRGDQITAAMPFSSAPDHVVEPPTRTPAPSRPTVAPAVVAPAPEPEAVRRGVAELFAGHGVKGITFAPGTTDHVGRGALVQEGVADLLAGAPGAVVTLVAHAWDGETTTHRCDVLALRRAELVREFLVARGVPAEAIRAEAVVDPVWGPPSEGGPQVDVLVG